MLVKNLRRIVSDILKIWAFLRFYVSPIVCTLILIPNLSQTIRSFIQREYNAFYIYVKINQRTRIAANNRKFYNQSRQSILYCYLDFVTFIVIYAGNTDDILYDKRLGISFSNL